MEVEFTTILGDVWRSRCGAAETNLTRNREMLACSRTRSAVVLKKRNPECGLLGRVLYLNKLLKPSILAFSHLERGDTGF